MSNLFARVGEAMLQKVAPQEVAEALCTSSTQYRCYTRCSTSSGTSGILRQARTCYSGSACEKAGTCTAWRNITCSAVC